MSFPKQWLVHQLAYSAWANHLLLVACASLAPEELNRELGSSHGTVLDTMRHIYYAERVWLKRLRANSLPPLVEIGYQRLFCDPPPEPDLTALQQNWPPVSDGLQEYVQDSTAVDFSGELRGVDCSIPIWKLLFHTVNHSTLHRGQVLSMLRQLGKQPPNLDIFSFHLCAG
jgi:uncharacterized damage-inducible protein DinB